METRPGQRHHVYTKDGRIERVVIPIHGNSALKIGLQRALMKIIPVSEDELWPQRQKESPLEKGARRRSRVAS